MPTTENKTQTADLAELDRLRKENAQLKADLATAKPDPYARPEAKAPSFGMSEGERSDLETSGQTTSPFTGEVRTK